MNFIENQLQNFLIPNLYSNVLVITEDEKKVDISNDSSKEDSKPQEIAFNFLGDNKKEIVLIVNEPNAVFLTDECYNFLSNLLAACKLNMADVAIININKQPLTFDAIKTKMKVSFAILFDVNTGEINLPFTIPQYQIQPYNNCKFLVSTSLYNLSQPTQEAKLEKSKLWVCLKNLFQL